MRQIELQNYWREYRQARELLMRRIGVLNSNRDPVSEFAEVLVADLLEAQKPTNRTQKNWDLRSPKYGTIEVRSLSSSRKSSYGWNWHTIAQGKQRDLYALVIFEDFKPLAVHVFPCNRLEPIGVALKKRHRNADTTIQYTKKNFETIRDNEKYFETLGMMIFSFEDKSLIPNEDA